ncbi:MAG: hypothetical protein DLM73_14435 [Chthoniobacterales bacterium]|nr:MAG: hypothetical protein DLM73_14435 [Chthoniobacterales bacterium]
MSEAIITVEGLGKKYRLGAGRSNERYTALRDVVADKAKSLFRRNGKPTSDLRPLTSARATQEDFWALKDVSFEVKLGEVLGIIGRNGAGKSTLLKILSRITEPTEGRIKIKGRVASLLEVGTGFHPELTGRENIYLNGAILGMSRAEIKAKFDEIVAFAEVEKFLDTPVKRYSSGMYVRLAFAVAAHLEPEILVVDEVLSVGDAEFQKKCLGKMSEVSKEGRTVLFVSHNMPVIETLCSRAILLERGILQDGGDASEIVEKYLTRTIKMSQERLTHGMSKNIRSVIVINREGTETNQFAVGEDIIFDLELFSDGIIEHPRLSIGIHTPNGERLATIHTDIQQNSRWGFGGSRRVRAVCRNNFLVPARYRIDIGFWGFSTEIESLPGATHIDIVARDVYGTGSLPDASFQGHVVVDAEWEMDVADRFPKRKTIPEKNESC